MGSYLQAYLHMDMIIGEIKDLMNIAGDYLNHLQLQLNMLSLGHMSPSLISLGNLRVLLTDIKRRLPATLKIPGDEIKDIWNFYKFLTCSTVLDENRIIIIITLPLLDIRDSYAIYKIHNLPVPTKVTEKNSDSSNMVAQYELEAVVIAANQEKTKYMLLSNQEIDKCSNPLVNFCEIKSPVYPVNLSKLCVIALFANKENWKTRCTVKVRPNTVLPMATYLTDSMWAVTTINEFRITIRCDDQTNMLTDQIINPPTTIINLKRTCTATSDHLTLLPTYQMESTFLTEKTFDRFLNTFQRLSSVNLVFLEIPPFSVNHWNKSHQRRHHILTQSDLAGFKKDDFTLCGQIETVNQFIRETNRILQKHSHRLTLDLQNSRRNLDDDTSSVLNDSFIEENEFPDLDQSSVVIAPIIDIVPTPSSEGETTPQPFNIVTVPDTPVPLPKFPELLTMYKLAKCSTFSGYPQDNAKRFLAEFESYALLQYLAEQDKCRIAAFHLHGLIL
ncbi:unnamed protein product [Mytilus coruscus]|uniref:Uncharacterized protein n=1 Tax=Mytilus coruscus TaxID=42192 RepID=A0A6J8DL87_MYTCO|nr:unnamed protein product [Mytilus coruscus]